VARREACHSSRAAHRRCKGLFRRNGPKVAKDPKVVPRFSSSDPQIEVKAATARIDLLGTRSTGTNGTRRHLVGKGERLRRLTRRSSADQFRSNNFNVVKTDQPRSAQQLRRLNEKVVELSS
jgi:hypothetical protein